MFLPKTAKYALQALTYITLENRGGYIPAGDLSKKIGIPLPFLSKIMRRLVSQQLLKVKKGPKGGFKLAVAPEKIRFFDILSAAGYPFGRKHCLFGWKKCGSDNPCPLHHSWSQINDSFLHWAEETRLSGLITAEKSFHPSLKSAKGGTFYKLQERKK